MFRRMLAVLALTAAALTTTAAAHADTTYRGEGDDVVRIHATKKPGLIRFTHDGESNFIVHTVDPRGRAGEYLVNEIGPYTGTVLYNDYGTRGTSGLEIKADGFWTATFLPLSKARCWCSATIRGTGDQVLKLSPTRGLHTVRGAYNGESNFIVHAHTRIGSYSDLLFNEIGRYRGKALLPVGTRLVTVHADGAWTLTRN
ncbi:hypothetical protein SAMN05421833_12825 [Microbispora rosea]|uniref:Uncharacterized protein n=1 Tax=Microbispora rosea TaxID=58117 RepID=A0A1N7GE29_9ACTN|nr:hypothetical protein [Microbispora rosea]GIH50625.1 hypothetical protein Mro03_58040 [Microbispora rosea subsp. rosea]SIS10800.1 hypothetical protein SAMN05421833_12825 [Microbispora rosea]